MDCQVVLGPSYVASGLPYSRKQLTIIDGSVLVFSSSGDVSNANRTTRYFETLGSALAPSAKASALDRVG